MTYRHTFRALTITTITIASTWFCTTFGDTKAVATPTATPAIPQSRQPVITPPAPQIDAKGFVLMDANTGAIIAEKNMHKQMPPASLTKLMTLYVASQAIKQGQISLDDKVRISEKAWRTGGSRMFLKEGSQVPVHDLIKGIIVASGNDACVALSQYVGGNEATFVDMMNQTAQQLGMKDTHYVDSTGLPNPKHYSTPYDLTVLARAIIQNFPEDYSWYKQKWITYNGIKQPNRNRLLWRDKSVDGLKTGHTKAAGYCLISSAKRDDMRLISVVLGAPTDSERASDSQALLNWGFRFYESHKLYDANHALATPRVWLGKNKTIALGIQQPMYVTIPAGSYSQLKPQLTIDTPLQAPIAKGKKLGTLNVTLNGKNIATMPLVALEDDAKAGFFSRAWDHIILLFKKL